MKRKKIVLVVLKNDNIGDSVIADTCEYLIRNIDNTLDVSLLNLLPEPKDWKKHRVRYTYTYPKWKQIFKFLKYKLFSMRGTKIYKFYEQKLKNSDGVVFAGGGIIKHTREAFWNPIHTIVNYCDKHRIPVYFNAVGIEGYDEKNFFSRVIKNTLNKDIIKKITTRDDIDCLGRYVEDKTKLQLVGDPALWVKEAYPDFKYNQNNTKIGIGVIRGRIFTDYGFDFSEELVLKSYVNIIKTLEKEGFEWQLFCNGRESDYLMGQNILENLNITDTKKFFAPSPKTSEDLINLVSNYKGTVSARLHANIVAVALGIPTVGFVWNDKLKLFSQQLGIENRFLEPTLFSDAEFVVKQLKDAIVNGYQQDVIDKLKTETKINLEQFINSL